MKLFGSLLMGVLWLSLVLPADARPSAPDRLELVAADRTSSYRIYVGAEAPASVQAAADDLAHCIELATGVRLPILREAVPPDAPLISLGLNPAARAAGLTRDGIAVEGYRIVARGRDVFILGHDTPDGQITPQGGTARGTHHGVSAFLERELDVRFLMPGDIGLDVPTRTTWSVDASLDVSDQPLWPRRVLAYIQENHPQVQEWAARQKLGGALQINHAHSWVQYVPATLFEKHPDWFAMHNGQRSIPIGQYKLETTNPQMVAHFGEGMIRWFQQRERHRSFPLSPSDLEGWSTSPESLALTEKDPHGRMSVTPLVLDFYRNMAGIAQAQMPDRTVAGYVYGSYLYPPAEGLREPLPENLHLVLAPHENYGYRLYRDDMQQELEFLLGAWGELTPKLSYYDLFNWIYQNIGAPPAPGIGILKFMFPRLADAELESVYLYGQEAWGAGALSNYVLARLLWDPRQDPEAIAEEFIQRAYGLTAAPFMAELYALLDTATETHFRAHAEASYIITPAMLRGIYAATYPQVEALYLQARAAATEERHQQRLAMFEKNLLLLRWTLVSQNMLPADPQSPLFRDNQAIAALLQKPNDDLAMNPRSLVPRDQPRTVDQVRVRLAEPVTERGPAMYLFRHGIRTLVFPQRDTDVFVRASHITDRGSSLRYTLIDSMGQVVQSGLLGGQEPVQFFARDKEPMFFDVAASGATYKLEIQGAPWAVKTSNNHERGDKGLHLFVHTTPLHFAVEPGTESFTLTLHSESPGETADIRIVSPSGRVAARLDTLEQQTVRHTVPTQGEAGMWRITYQKPVRGILEDVWVQFNEGVAPWVSLDGRAPLVITPLN